MNYQEWSDWWTKHSPEYFTDKIWRFSQPKLISKLNIKKNTRVLEIGFGYGRELSQFCKLSDFVNGLELTDFACENTSRYLLENDVQPLPTLHRYDGINLPGRGIFDIIYSCFVIQHLSKAHAKLIIKNCLNRLSDSGSILFEFFGDPTYHDGEMDVFSENEEWGRMYNNAYTEQEIISMISNIGGNISWIEKQNITKDWCNYWVCFAR